MSYDQTFPARLHTARKNKEFTQKKLADLVGLSHSAVVTYENGKRTPSIDTLTKFASVLDVCCSWLLGDVTDNPQSIIKLLNIHIDAQKDNLDTKNMLIEKLLTENKDMQSQLMTLGRMQKIFEEKRDRVTNNGSKDASK